jgi:hypothetical protein
MVSGRNLGSRPARLYRVTKAVQLTPGNPRPPTMEVRANFRIVH